MLILGWVLLVPAALVFAVALWNMLAWPAVGFGTVEDNGQVSVLIPARNEAATIDDCIASALEQGDIIGAVWVYDDHSTDATAEHVRAWAEKDSRVRLCPPKPLPPDWCGKPFACAQLADAAETPWMLFLDADARLEPGAVRRLVAEAEARGVTLLAPWPGIVCGGFWEKALMPLLNFCVFTFFPAPLALRRRDTNMGLAHGACILAQREAYHAVGGHGVVRNELFEDTWLARRWREAGQPSACLDGSRVVRVRMYDSFAAIWFGFMKNFRPAFRRESRFWMFWGFHALCIWVPFALLPAAWATGQAGPLLAAVACVLGSRMIMAWRFRYPWWSALLHPLAESLFLALGLASWRRWRLGEGVAWKGRVYGPTTKVEATDTIATEERPHAG